ncbi:class C beta-lactamase [Pseudomonas frederiksbergensis]|uniref:Beta-lactamase n=1 Tax=Pseudomonas frederiksbergensis TaxID=104087 RepID=A0A1J0EG12_9PSED|nr:class C beta-lactamase [Pseudomonas frederiksbergensis]APC14977.1 class C beta-lactamase [Pseudomonas frederiksbergensis]
MRLIKKRCAASLLLACTASFGNLAMANAEPSAIDSIVQDAAQKVMQQYNIPGLAIAVTANGKQQFYNFGVASKETQQKVTSDTLFEIGSISKTFTVTLATYAEVNGQLSLTDHPGKYLPALAGSPFDKVTLVNLATHTAGGFPLQVPDQVQNNQQLMDYFKTWQPTYAPGAQRTYANPSIGALGMIAATSMKMPFAVALEQRLFPELGMPNSFINVPTSKISLYAQGYNKLDAPVRLNSGVLGDEAYSVKTSATDLIRFVEANLGVAKVEAKLSRALMETHKGYFQVGPMTQDLIWEQYDYPVQLSALLEGNADKMIYESHVVTALNPPLSPQEAVWVNKTGSTGGFSAYVAFVPEKKLGIVVLANKSYPNEPRVRLAHRILSELDH